MSLLLIMFILTPLVAGDCDNFHWGPSCNKTCSPNCGGWGCDVTTGDCIQCPYKSWGPDCTYVCPQHCDTNCDTRSGNCNWCQYGYWGLVCTKTCAKDCLYCDKNYGGCYKYKPTGEIKDNDPKFFLIIFFVMAGVGFLLIILWIIFCYCRYKRIRGENDYQILADEPYFSDEN